MLNIWYLRRNSHILWGFGPQSKKISQISKISADNVHSFFHVWFSRMNVALKSRIILAAWRDRQATTSTLNDSSYFVRVTRTLPLIYYRIHQEIYEWILNKICFVLFWKFLCWWGYVAQSLAAGKTITTYKVTFDYWMKQTTNFHLFPNWIPGASDIGQYVWHFST